MHGGRDFKADYDMARRKNDVVKKHEVAPSARQQKFIACTFEWNCFLEWHLTKMQGGAGLGLRLRTERNGYHIHQQQVEPMDHKTGAITYSLDSRSFQKANRANSRAKVICEIDMHESAAER